MTDRTTKLLLAAIALGLFANALIPLLTPKPAAADSSDTYLRSIDTHLSNIQSDIHNLDRTVDKIANIESGNCHNSKICR